MPTPFVRTRSLWIIGAIFVVAGTLHFVFPTLYLRVMPPILPSPLFLVYLSGAAEIAGGLGVLSERLHRAAGYGLIALLIAVFPANLYMLLLQYRESGLSFATLVLILRLPLQYMLIRWVARSTYLIERGLGDRG